MLPSLWSCVLNPLVIPRVANTRQWKFNFFRQRHPLSMSFDIFIVTFWVIYVLPELAHMLLFSGEKNWISIFCFPLFSGIALRVYWKQSRVLHWDQFYFLVEFCDSSVLFKIQDKSFVLLLEVVGLSCRKPCGQLLSVWILVSAQLTSHIWDVRICKSEEERLQQFKYNGSTTQNEVVQTRWVSLTKSSSLTFFALCWPLWLHHNLT